MENQILRILRNIQRIIFDVLKKDIAETVKVHAICYNEEKMLPFFIKHYQVHFPLCKIVIYDNYSTDNSVQLARDLGCEVKCYDTKGEIKDSIWQQMKNTCWKGQKEKWAIVVDCDELINADQKSLVSNQPFNVWKFQGIQMVGEGQAYDEINYGVPDDVYSKPVLFNTRQIAEMNYAVGAHTAKPVAKKGYKVDWCMATNTALYHYKWVDLVSVLAKHRHYAERLSDENKANSWSYHYAEAELQQRKYYDNLLEKKILVK